PQTKYLTEDHLGTPRIITDATGQITARRDFLPFGEDLFAGVGSRSTSLKYGATADDIRQKFTGYEKDKETNLDFAEARMYENRFGRFTTVDPLLASGKSANPQTFNRYVYVINNPLVFNDPSGAIPEWVYDEQFNKETGKIRPTWVSHEDYEQNKDKYKLWENSSYTTSDGNVFVLDSSGPFSTEKGDYFGFRKNGFLQGTGVFDQVPFNGAHTSLVLQGMRLKLEASETDSLAKEFGLRIAAFCVFMSAYENRPRNGVMENSVPTPRTALPILGRHFTPDATKVLQNITNTVSSELAANPNLAQNVLSAGEYAAGQRASWLANMQYGNAVERLAAEHINQSPLHRQLFQYVGGPSRPDFVGRGIGSGLNFDITTPRAINAHLARPGYGSGLQVCTYERPLGFTTFPGN
ncbi:MAG TPA: RHS repeat-associated core domain-containing protein, partial [Nitrososphaeraceae archaeon]